MNKTFAALAVVGLVALGGCGRGDPGEKGSGGPPGPQGQAGPQGAQGPAGQQGAIGPQGPAGGAGPEGPAGPQGAAGPKGDKGEVGAIGPQGVAGAAGPAGPKGDKGDAGPAGPAGAPGPVGEKGETGPAGPAGAAGVAGVAAMSAKPAFSLRRFESADGKPVTGQCEAGEQLVAATCSASATVAEDGASATCAGPDNGTAAVKLVVSCATYGRARASMVRRGSRPGGRRPTWETRARGPRRPLEGSCLGAHP